MFGIGFWEMLVIAGLVLVAVGPERLPGMLKQLAKFYRQFRRTAEDVRASTGIDQLLRDEELKELAELRKQKFDLMGTGKPAAKPMTPAVKPMTAVKPAPVTAPGKEMGKDVPSTISSETAEAVPMGIPAKPGALGMHAKPSLVRGVSLEDREREHPPVGVDVAEIRRVEPPPTKITDVPPEHIHPSKAALFAANKGR